MIFLTIRLITKMAVNPDPANAGTALFGVGEAGVVSDFIGAEQHQIGLIARADKAATV